MNEARARLWQLVAETTHEAVCEASGTDGCGKCLWYSTFGMAFANHAFCRKGESNFIPQLGELCLFSDPSDPTLAFVMLAGPTSRVTGEFHSWLYAPAGRGEFDVIDLSSRHYPALVERTPLILNETQQGDDITIERTQSYFRWRREVPPWPLVLRIKHDRWPDDYRWVRFVMKPDLTDNYLSTVRDLYQQHKEIVLKHARRLNARLAGKEVA